MVLVVNIGSSSVKLGLFAREGLASSSTGEPAWESRCDLPEDPAERVNAIRGLLADVPEPERVTAVGHRVVHGGDRYHEAVRITAAVKHDIERFASYAPIHNPLNLFGIEAAEAAFPRAVQVAVFDTAFHSTLPPEAAIYPGPYEWYERGIRRYGFHGISHQYCAMRAAELLQTDVTKLRLITCHLGSGCSLAAIEYGKSIDTTMGFTPLDGLMMGTRSGSIDPGIIFHLLRQGTYSVEELENVLNHSSGLLGVSGVSNDMRRVLHAAHHGNARAEMAIAAYVHRVRGQIGAMMAALGGFAALVFTGGVGENSPEIRARICDRLRSAGIEVDAERNESLHGDGEISASGRAWRVLVVRAREEWAVARETAAAECGKSPHSTNDLHN